MPGTVHGCQTELTTTTTGGRKRRKALDEDPSEIENSHGSILDGILKSNVVSKKPRTQQVPLAQAVAVHSDGPITRAQAQIQKAAGLSRNGIPGSQETPADAPHPEFIDLTLPRKKRGAVKEPAAAKAAEMHTDIIATKAVEAAQMALDAFKQVAATKAATAAHEAEEAARIAEAARMEEAKGVATSKMVAAAKQMAAIKRAMEAAKLAAVANKESEEKATAAAKELDKRDKMSSPNHRAPAVGTDELVEDNFEAPDGRVYTLWYPKHEQANYPMWKPAVQSKGGGKAPPQEVRAIKTGTAALMEQQREARS
ncbi:hypothetical protein DFH27DRAFT_619037 [Peziza echinospora]|nr:hypothetical protein DFH27DRAFT_619037 [Peziza echinospora]